MRYYYYGTATYSKRGDAGTLITIGVIDQYHEAMRPRWTLITIGVIDQDHEKKGENHSALG